MLHAVGARQFFPSLARVAIERTACTKPRAYGLHLTRWDSRSLAQVVAAQAVVDSIHYTTVARILAAASLQPHRSRYWKTATIDEQFTQRAAKILWCYEQGEWLSRRGEVVLCLDEKPNIQALSRTAPKQLMGPGWIERRKFEYERRGASTFLVALHVLNGTMRGCGLERNDHKHFSCGMRQVVQRYCTAKRIHLVMDNGASHIDRHTQAYFTAHPRLRVLLTPAHASWLNQAELLLRAFRTST